MYLKHREVAEAKCPEARHRGFFSKGVGTSTTDPSPRDMQWSYTIIRQGVRWIDDLGSADSHFKNNFLTFLYPILVLTM